ncbi:MAG: tetratricopeptide repeat protein [Myxococcota bacterium]|nr:tetratricopeptide repeat protein [Myxococcota bacterium]
MLYLFYALGALKIWMLIDAIQRGVAAYWFCVIVCVPFGSVIYFFMVKAPELGIGSGGTRYRPVKFRRPTRDLKKVRHLYDENPCLANEALLASALYDAGEIDEAADHFRRALARDPVYQRALYGLALCHRARGEHAQAVELLRKLLDEERSYAGYRAWLELANTLAEAGEVDEAVASLERLVAACPRMDHCVALADRLSASGQKDRARAQLERALRDYQHAPRHVKRQFRPAARQAHQRLGQLA